MKKLVVIALSLVCAIGAFAQGTINFNNRVTGAGGVVAPIYGPDPTNPTLEQHGDTNSTVYRGAPLLGTGFSAALFGGPAGTPVGNLVLISQVSFRTQTTLPGFITPPALAPTVPGVDGGSQATFEIRAWDNQGGTIGSWAALLARNNPNDLRGTSNPFTPTTPLTVPPSTPINLTGLTSFNIHTVPEPSVIALGVLGLGALLLRRRK